MTLFEASLLDPSGRGAARQRIGFAENLGEIGSLTKD
jgi:hypothetical protein